MTIISGATIVVLLSVPTLLYSAASLVTGRKRHHNHDGFGREIYSRDNSIRKEQKQMAKAQKQR
jgi:hypothetical protein